MIAPDVMLLLYAYDSKSEFYRQASDYWSDALSTDSPIGIPIQCIHGFLRIITHPSAGPKRMAMPEALEIVEEWLERPQVRLLMPGPRHWTLLRETVTKARAAGGFVSDVAIAAVAIEYGAELHTTDRGFARIPGLRWSNPLMS